LKAASEINGPDRGGLLATEPSLTDRLNALAELDPRAALDRR
jgi:hypothetical protein